MWLLMGFSNDKNLGLRPRFLSTESLGPCFSHGTGDHDQILQQIMLVVPIPLSLYQSISIFGSLVCSEMEIDNYFVQYKNRVSVNMNTQSDKIMINIGIGNGELLHDICPISQPKLTYLLCRNTPQCFFVEIF